MRLGTPVSSIASEAHSGSVGRGTPRWSREVGKKSGGVIAPSFYHSLTGQVSNCGVDSTAETDLVTHFQCPTSAG